VPSSDKFAGGDQGYLRDEQYRDPAKLTARVNLHRRYGTAPVAWFPWMADQVEWPSTADVLEVGCGPGWLWAEATEQLPPGLRLTLTDLSPGMVDAAASRVTALDRFELVESRPADAQALPYDDASFDVVLANAMLYHVPDPSAAVGELARVMRSDGVVVASTIGHRHLRELWEIRAEVFGVEPASETVEVFGVDSGEQILAERFDHVEWREYEDELRCTDAADVVAYIASTPPAEDGSPEQIGHVRRVVDRRFDEGGGVFLVSKETGVFLTHGPLDRPRAVTSRGNPQNRVAGQ
jgi:ubiquinone/menaquinone biosynthesis C-methylase UbiE